MKKMNNNNDNYEYYHLDIKRMYLFIKKKLFQFNKLPNNKSKDLLDKSMK
jgi:hypothetical protein